MVNSMTLVFGSIVFCLGLLVVWLVYYFWKVHTDSNLDHPASATVTQNAGKENREHSRVDIHWPVSMETPEGTIKAEVTNISVGGAFICCEKPLPIGEMFRLTMMGPDKEPVIATAKVAWSNVNVPEDKVINRGMGVRFVNMSDRHIRLMRQMFQESGRGSQGNKEK
jgi:uncharacterized protein (TIGR02266 family)